MCVSHAIVYHSLVHLNTTVYISCVANCNCADPSELFMHVKWTSFTAGPGVDHWNSDSESLENLQTLFNVPISAILECKLRMAF